MVVTSSGRTLHSDPWAEPKSLRRRTVRRHERCITGSATPRIPTRHRGIARRRGRTRSPPARGASRPKWRLHRRRRFLRHLRVPDYVTACRRGAGDTAGLDLGLLCQARARRILPVACFVIAVTVVAAYFQLGPLIGRKTALDGRWAAGFAANLRFIHQGTDYFASDIPPSPLQHFWSLAVEEQFYLVWPTLLFALVAFGRLFDRSVTSLRVGLCAVVAASLYWSVHQSTLDPTTAYFSPFTRAWELGAGALIAVFAVGIARIPGALRTGSDVGRIGLHHPCRIHVYGDDRVPRLCCAAAG